MNHFGAFAFAAHHEQLLALGEQCENISNQGVPVPGDLKATVWQSLGTALDFCQRYGFKEAASDIQLIKIKSGLPGGLDAAVLLKERVERTKDSLVRDLQSRRFLYIAKDRADYLDQPSLFGGFVKLAFPSALRDIQEAGNCLAVECNTAAVFHLMRVVEYGLRALAKDRQIEVPKGPLELATWEDIIKQLELAEQAIHNYPKTLAREAQYDFYHGAMMELRRFKNRFRNPIMHTRDNYDRDEALSAFNHVKAFMEILADKISEQSGTPMIWQDI